MKRSSVKKIRRFLIEYFNLEEFRRSYWFTCLLSNLLYELQSKKRTKAIRGVSRNIANRANRRIVYANKHYNYEKRRRR